MPVAKVNEEGIEIAYIDSGVPPSGGNYTTLVIIHGLTWSCAIFQKVIASAPSHGLRIIALNRRDYPGSSPFTLDEMAPIAAEGCTADTFRSFMRDRALEYGGFLKSVIEAGGVTKPDGQHGGIVLMGWSLGNTTGLNFLENVSTFAASLKEIVMSYVRSYIIFDAPLEVAGYPNPSPEQVERLKKIISSADPGNLDNIMKGLIAINDTLSGWYQYTSTDPVKRYTEPKTFKETTRQKEQSNPDFNKCFHPSAITNENILFKGGRLGVSESTFRSLVRTKDGAAKLWPGMDIQYLYCENSCWTCVYGAEMTQKVFEEDGSGRKVKVIKEANHFIHWEDPELFIKGVLPLL